MEKILEELAVNFPGNEDLIQVYRDWYDTRALKELVNELDRYEPDWNKEKELGSWAAEFILDILQEKEEQWEEMTTEERKNISRIYWMNGMKIFAAATNLHD